MKKRKYKEDEFPIFFKEDNNLIFIKEMKEVYYFLEKEFKLFKIESKKFYSLYIRSIRENEKLFSLLKEDNSNEINLSSFVCFLDYDLEKEKTGA